MNKSQANRSVLAARAAATPSIRVAGRPATDLTARVLTVVPVNGPMRRRGKSKMTGAQINSIGKRSEWSMPASGPALFTDPKWDQTVSSQHIGEAGYR